MLTYKFNTLLIYKYIYIYIYIYIKIYIYIFIYNSLLEIAVMN